ncbi:MAG: deoxyhypusine synthase [Flavobacteriales bacterium]|nr:deoxyhypusine synthase [Flavobacteriales bacterium]
MNKKQLLQNPIKHIDIKKPAYSGMVELMEDMSNMAFQSRNLARGARIYNQMIADQDCTIYLTLAGSLISAGLKKVIVDLVQNNMVDVIVSTGANIVDQDFFEALGHKHYKGSPDVDDNLLREMGIDRIYDTYINEEELKNCDQTITDICNGLNTRPYSSREFIHEMGRYLKERNDLKESRDDSIVFNCYEKQVPIFVPAFSDCSAGFGLVKHQVEHPAEHVSMDSAKDFLELTKIKMQDQQSGIFMIGGGVPKNFVQDIVVAAEILEKEVPMHKYAVQITVADERDGALSGSTLREASSWGKVNTLHEQMIFSEATIALPLLAAYAYHKGDFEKRRERKLNTIFYEVTSASG